MAALLKEMLRESTLTENYLVLPGQVLQPVGYFRAFPYRVALFPWIRIGLYTAEKHIQQHEQLGTCFKRLLQSNQHSMETTMQHYNYPDKHVPY